MVFGREKRHPAAKGSPVRPSTEEQTVVGGGSHHHQQGHAASNAPRGKFSFNTWIRLWGVDLITMAAMGAVGLGVYEAPPAPSRSFPVYFANGEVVYPDYAYPLRKEVIPIWLAAFLAFIVPFVFFAIFQIRRRSFNDLTATTMGLLQSLITAAVFQVFLKWLIGGFRPHFLEVCAPNIPEGSIPSGNGFANLFYDRSICTGDKDQIDDSLESFPSGHSTAAAAGFVYLSLYFNAQLKIFSDFRPAYWKHVLFFAPLLGTVLIAGALTIDKFHHAHDVIAGVLIGSFCAFASFRMVFAAIWDFRFNHITLPRTESIFLRHPHKDGSSIGAQSTRFGYGLGGGSDIYGASGNEESLRHRFGVDAPFCREAGWGPGVPSEGAPGDAMGTRIGGVVRGAGGVGGGAMAQKEIPLRHDHGHQRHEQEQTVQATNPNGAANMV